MPARLGRTFIALCLAALALMAPVAARAQPTFPALTGRVVDAANIIPADEKARLEQKLAALETRSRRQLVVATLPDLQGYEISDYGYQLGRAWGIGQQAAAGQKESNNGAILIVAPKERKVRIEVGYGLEGVLTDGLSALIIQQAIVPRFKAGDMAGGIEAGTDAIIQHLALPAEEAAKIAAAADAQAARRQPRGVDTGMVVFIIFVLIFFVLPMLRRGLGGRRYRSGASVLGPLIVFDALSHMSGRGGGFGGGGGGWSGGGGFSGGGGSFGGGGASGSW